MRITTQDHNMRLAFVTADRATCSRRKVGCVLVNERNQLLSSGYNGPPTGMTHCTASPCAGAGLPSGQGLDKCEAVHAEQNALLQCPDVHLIQSAFITASPCMTCVKLLLNTSCKNIYFVEEYAHTDAKNLWKSNHRLWIKLDKPVFEL